MSKNIIINGQLFTDISNIKFKTRDGQVITFREESELVAHLEYMFSGNVVSKYTGNSINIEIPGSYSLVDGEPILGAHFINSSNLTTDEAIVDFWEYYRISDLLGSSYSTLIDIRTGTTYNYTLGYIYFDRQMDENGNWVYVIPQKLKDFIQNDLDNIVLQSYLQTSYPYHFSNINVFEYPIIVDGRTINSTSEFDSYLWELPSGDHTFDFTGIEKIAVVGNDYIVTDIAYESFINNKTIKTLSMNDNITTIKGRAFYGCENLKQVQFSNNLLTLESQAFTRCTNLETIELPENLEFIGQQCFLRGGKAESVVIPSKVNYMAQDSFSEMPNLKTVDFQTTGNIRYFAYDCLRNNPSLNTVILPNNWSYHKETDLTYNGLFPLCPLEEIIISDTNPYYKSINGVIHSKNGTKLITYPSGLKNTHYVTESNVTSIIASAFSNNDNIESVDLTNVQTIGSSAFSGCENLKQVQFSNNLNKLGWCSFQSCASLQNVILPESLEYIDYGAFYGCTSLLNLHIPKNVSKINGNIVTKCGDLTITIDDENPYYTLDGNFLTNKTGEKLYYQLVTSFDNELIDTLEVPKSITIIGSSDNESGYVFGYQTVKNLVIHDNVTSIESAAIQGLSGLESITIGANVQSICSQGLYNSDINHVVYCRATTPPIIQSNSLYAFRINKVYIPTGTLSAYQSATNWSRMSSKFVEMDFEEESSQEIWVVNKTPTLENFWQDEDLTVGNETLIRNNVGMHVGEQNNIMIGTSDGMFIMMAYIEGSWESNDARIWKFLNPVDPTSQLGIWLSNNATKVTEDELENFDFNADNYTNWSPLV